MAYNTNLLQRLYDATDNGRRIFEDFLPGMIIKGDVDKMFSIRVDDDHPSAHLYRPKGEGKPWHLKDFGGLGKDYSPIDFYMLHRGYGRDQFSFALYELAERYGVSDRLDPKLNVRQVKVREATPEERNMKPQIDFFDSFDGFDLGRIFLPKVKSEHLEAYGWKPVKFIRMVTKKGELKEVTADVQTYPIFAQECHHTDEQGRDYVSHYKIYEPFNPNPQYRFSYIGDVPTDYMYGRDHLLRQWRKNDQEQLPVVLVVSGGSDAICALAYGYPSVWFNSESRRLKGDELSWLQKYCKRVVYVADIDGTGIREGMTQALSLPSLYTAWINPKELGGLHDSRGKLRKDLKDYLTLHPLQKDMDRLVQGAKCSCLWVKEVDEKGKVKSIFSESNLVYFLWLNGYSQLADDSDPRAVYIFEKDNIVHEVTAKTIRNFAKEWADREGLSISLQDELKSKCRTMITDTGGYLRMCDDLDFNTATPTSQRLPFKNGIVTVTAERISFQAHSSIPDGHYIWADSVIPHTYRPMKPMFSWTKNEEGRYVVTFSEDAPSKMLRVVRNMARLYWRKEDELGQELTAEEQADEMQALVVIMLAIGYLLHRYKSPSAAYAELFLDYAIGNNAKERNGRSGKSFLMKAVGKLLHHLFIDMSNLSKKSNQQFGFAGVKRSTGLVIVDECPENFAFNELYPKITDDLEVERKKENPIIIPFSQAPKFAVATNYTLKDHSPSTEGRFAPVVVGDYYHVKSQTNDYLETRQISDTFDMNLLDDAYPEADWQADFHFMLECLQFHLSLSEKERRQWPPMKQIERRELQAAMSDTFREWADETLGEGSEYLDKQVNAETLYEQYKKETDSIISKKGFTSQLKKWSEYASYVKCFNPASITLQKNDGDRWTPSVTGKKVNSYYIQTYAGAHQATEQALPF